MLSSLVDNFNADFQTGWKFFHLHYVWWEQFSFSISSSDILLWIILSQIFAPYGRVEDVYIMRDELKQSRGTPYNFQKAAAVLSTFDCSWNFFFFPYQNLVGCGFVKFSGREMAIAAMSALNGTYVMRVNSIYLLELVKYKQLWCHWSWFIFVRDVISH